MLNYLAFNNDLQIKRRLLLLKRASEKEDRLAAEQKLAFSSYCDKALGYSDFLVVQCHFPNELVWTLDALARVNSFQWALNTIGAINVGIQLDTAWCQWVIWLLEDRRLGLKKTLDSKYASVIADFSNAFSNEGSNPLPAKAWSKLEDSARRSARAETRQHVQLVLVGLAGLACWKTYKSREAMENAIGYLANRSSDANRTRTYALLGNGLREALYSCNVDRSEGLITRLRRFYLKGGT